LIYLFIHSKELEWWFSECGIFKKKKKTRAGGSLKIQITAQHSYLYAENWALVLSWHPHYFSF
jgi:hypothetical protein